MSRGLTKPWLFGDFLDDTETLVLMGRMKAWRRNLSDRAAAEIFTRHLPDDSRHDGDKQDTESR
jgi:hypothetical protein